MENSFTLLSHPLLASGYRVELTTLRRRSNRKLKA